MAFSSRVVRGFISFPEGRRQLELSGEEMELADAQKPLFQHLENHANEIFETPEDCLADGMRFQFHVCKFR